MSGKVSTIGSESEGRLADALAQAYADCLDGALPDDALAKAAADHVVPPGQIKLLTYAYNTGRAEHLRTLGKTAAERMQSFPMATTAGILQRLAPDDVARHTALKQADTAYAAPPPPAWRREAPTVKTAAADRLAPNEDQQVRNELKSNRWRSLRSGRWAAGWKERDEARQKAQASRFDMQAALDKMLDKNAALVGYFQLRDALTLAEVQAHSEVLFGKHASTLLAGLAERVPPQRRGPLPTNLRPAVPERAPYRFVGELLKAAHDYLHHREEARRRTQVAQDAEVILKEAVRMERELHGEVFPEEPTLKTAFWGNIAGSAIGAAAAQDIRSRMPLQKSLDQLRDKALQKITDPEHESRLRNMQVETTLADLLANDSVISGYDPNEILENYNEIARLGPRIATQPAVVRALLRRRLQQGAADPFELDSMLKMENNLRNSASGGMPGAGGGSDGGIAL